MGLTWSDEVCSHLAWGIWTSRAAATRRGVTSRQIRYCVALGWYSGGAGGTRVVFGWSWWPAGQKPAGRQ